MNAWRSTAKLKPECITFNLRRSTLAALTGGGWAHIHAVIHAERERVVALYKIHSPDFEPLVCTAVRRGWSAGELQVRLRQQRVAALIKASHRQTGAHRHALMAEARRVNGGPLKASQKTDFRRRD